MGTQEVTMVLTTYQMDSVGVLGVSSGWYGYTEILRGQTNMEPHVAPVAFGYSVRA